MSNVMTVHLEERPVYDIVMEPSFARLPKLPGVWPLLELPAL